jgi:hypothetical protein
MPQPQQEPGWIESMLKPLFDRMGLNGNANLRKATAPHGKPQKKSPSDKELKALGYDDSDIADFRVWEARARNQTTVGE